MPAEIAASNLVRFLDTKAPQLAAMLSRGDLRLGFGLFEHFLEKILPAPEWLGWLDKDAVLASYVLDIFDHSQHFAEQLIRTPELLGELRGMREGSEHGVPYAELAAALGDPASLACTPSSSPVRPPPDSRMLRA